MVAPDHPQADERAPWRRHSAPFMDLCKAAASVPLLGDTTARISFCCATEAHLLVGGSAAWNGVRVGRPCSAIAVQDGTFHLQPAQTTSVACFTTYSSAM